MHTKAGITGRNPLKGNGHAQTKAGMTGRNPVKGNGHAQRKTGITGRNPLNGCGHALRKTGITRRKETIVERCGSLVLLSTEISWLACYATLSHLLKSLT